MGAILRVEIDEGGWVMEFETRIDTGKNVWRATKSDYTCDSAF